MPSPLDIPPRLANLLISDDWTLCSHARARMTEFGLKVHDVEDVLFFYEQSYMNRDGQAVRQKGDWAVYVNTVTKVVVTVLRRTYDRWDHQ